MKKYCIMKGDTNDGDYITSKKEITDSEIEQLKPILKKIGRGSSNWNTRWEYDKDELADLIYKDVFTEEQFDLMSKFIPNGEYGIHTLESVEILEVQDEIKLL